MTPHTPDAESVNAPAEQRGTSIYTPSWPPRKGLSKTFKVAFTLTVTDRAGRVRHRGGSDGAVHDPHAGGAAQRNECPINLRRIGARDGQLLPRERGRVPRVAGRLLVAQKLSEDLFVCPAGRETPAPGATAQARAEQLVWARHLSYAYVGRGLNNRTGIGAGVTAVIASRLSNHGDGINVLFADGHVAFVPEPKGDRAHFPGPGRQEPPERRRVLTPNHDPSQAQDRETA